MPIVTTKPPVAPVEKPAIVQIASPQFKGTVVDTRYTPANSLLTHVEGSSWVVKYYSAIYNKDNALSSQQVTLSPVVQSYRFIDHLELKVTIALNTIQDAERSEMQLTGTATMYPGIIPNKGDAFIATMDDGRDAIFNITMTDRKSIFTETCYQIEYVMVDYADPQYSTTNRYSDLESKVVERLEFVSDFLQHGQNPLVQKSEFTIIRSLVENYHLLLERYLKQFTSSEYMTLIVPGQESVIYDHYLVSAFMKFHNTFAAPEIRMIRILNCDDDTVMEATTIWDALTYRNPTHLKNAIRLVSTVSSKQFSPNPLTNGIYYSGIKKVVYPRNAELTVDYRYYNIEKIISDIKIVTVPNRITDLNDLISQTELTSVFGSTNPLIKEVMVDDYYVFSEAFYKGDLPNQSQLELCVNEHIKGRPIDHRKLLAFCNTYHSWGAVEQFYYLPIVLLLVKANIRSL
jgi:hypothetical protein